MREQIRKCMQLNQIVEMIYMDRRGQVSKRRVKVIKMNSTSFQAFCMTKNAKRTFLIDNVLAIAPVVKRESVVI
ncbi:transcriptional regulator [Paenisporosarcina cavernae]|uniref:Transcriptional regulator n=1 Tax=Paenisporosarcina cavernae TaxID=2320858 RepID=A0A385YVN2_9BACL|nr:transcriptional regulator [Paenisporosarcina cavernae]